MLWVFDSWFGWLQTLKYLKNYFTDQDFLFLADSVHVPYGEKSKEEIRNYSTTCINRLYEQGCETIIIACNTAVAGLYEDRQYHCAKQHLIGVTYAGMQEVIRGPHRKIGVLCTEATKRLQVYPTIYTALRGEGTVHVVAAPALVPMIERNEKDVSLICKAIQDYVSQFPSDIDCIILWCTHYPVYLQYFRELYPQCKIIDPGRSSINAIARHIGYAAWKAKSDRSVRICCTGSVEKFQDGMQRLWAEPATVEKVLLF